MSLLLLFMFRAPFYTLHTNIIDLFFYFLLLMKNKKKGYRIAVDQVSSTVSSALNHFLACLYVFPDFADKKKQPPGRPLDAAIDR